VPNEEPRALIQSQPEPMHSVSSAAVDFTAELTFGRARFRVCPARELTHFDMAISKRNRNIYYLLCTSQGLMLTRVTASPWHLSRPASHSVMVRRAAEPLTSAQTSMPPSSHGPSSSQTQLLDCAKQKHREITFRMASDSTKNRLKCF